MKAIISILLLLGSFNVLGQDGHLRFTKIETSCHYGKENFTQYDSFYYDLPDISKSDFKTHIRIEFTGQIIDLFRANNESYNGILTNYIYETIESIKNKKTVKTVNLISNRVPLNAGSCSKAALFILNSKQLSFQMDSVYKTWQTGFADCDVILFKFKLSDTLISQHFVCPYGQNDLLVEKQIVIANREKLFQELNLKSLSDSFVSQLPKDCYDCSYSFGGNVSFLNVQEIKMNNRQRKIYVKK